MASPGDAVDLHAVWLPRSKLNSTAGSAAYRRGLVEAYMSVGNAMHDTAANLRGHVWTADPSLHALYRPVLGANGFEIEVPHSMIVHPKSKVTIHLRGGLETLVDGVEDASLRDDMRQLLENPACENIGFHSDVVRALVVLLYERQEVEGRALNVYADVDTLDDTTFLRDWRRTKPSESAPTAMPPCGARSPWMTEARSSCRWRSTTLPAARPFRIQA